MRFSNDRILFGIGVKYGNNRSFVSVTLIGTFADVTGDAADLPVDHLLVQLFDVERLNSEGQNSCQHCKHAHASVDTHNGKM